MHLSVVISGRLLLLLLLLVHSGADSAADADYADMVDADADLAAYLSAVDSFRVCCC
jgi:hypothetical protein